MRQIIKTICSALRTTDSSHRHAKHVIVLLVCVLTAGFTLRGVLFSSDRIPTTREGSATVPLFNVWTMQWNLVSLTHAESRYWNAPIFYPMPGTFAFSEPQPLTMVLLPAKWLGASPAVLYNVYLITSLSLNGIVAFRLLQLLSCRWMTSVACAIGMTLLPIVHHQLDVLQLVSIWPELWLLCCLLQCSQLLTEQQRPLSAWITCAVQTSLAIFCCAATCLHHALFVVMVLFCSGWLLVLPRIFAVFTNRRVAFEAGVADGEVDESDLEADRGPVSVPVRMLAGRCLLFVGLTTVAVALLVLPWLRPMRMILRSHEFQRSEKLVGQLSVEAKDLMHAGSGNLFPTLSPQGKRPWYGSPGNIRLGLAMMAIPLVILCRSQKRPGRLPDAFFLLVWTLAAGSLAMGIHLQFGDIRLWPILVKWIPGLAQIRSAFRFLFFYQIGILLLAALALDTLSGGLRRTSRWCSLCAVLYVVGLGLLAFEICPSPLRTVRVSADSETLAWIRKLSGLATKNRSVLILPYARSSEVEDFEETTRWMLSMVDTDLKMVNGYSGFFPRSHFEWQSFLKSRPAPWQLAERMRQHQVDVVVAGDPDFQQSFSEPAVTGLMFEEIPFPESATVRMYRIR
ncbi:MAG: hypothetical protein ACK58L_18565 [Planctomycetota bacterium]